MTLKSLSATRRAALPFLCLLAIALSLCHSDAASTLALPATVSSTEKHVAITQTVQFAFTQAVREHAMGIAVAAPAAPAVAQPQVGQPAATPVQHSLERWSVRLNDPIIDKGLTRSEAMESLVRQVRQSAAHAGKAQVNEYCLAAGQFLTDPRTQYAAVASEFLAHFPLQAIATGALPHIGQLLDDKREAFTSSTISVPQQDSAPIHFTVSR